MNKKALMGVIILLIIIFTIIFFVFKNNKKIENGNNNNNQILNINSYEAKMEITVVSNKTRNKYKVEQKYVSPNLTKQIVEEPENIRGLTTTYDGNKLTIENTQLKLTTVYEDYKYLTENNLFLNEFINDYNANESTKEEKDDKIILTVKCKNQDNKYQSIKKLYLDKKTNKPVQMEVQDINQNITVYILYNEIKSNSTKSEEIIN